MREQWELGAGRRPSHVTAEWNAIEGEKQTGRQQYTPRHLAVVYDILIFSELFIYYNDNNTNTFQRNSNKCSCHQLSSKEDGIQVLKRQLSTSTH